jgi:hypothetical protein
VRYVTGGRLVFPSWGVFSSQRMSQELKSSKRSSCLLLSYFFGGALFFFFGVGPL